MKPLRIIQLFSLFLIAISSACTPKALPEPELTPLTLQLKWVHQAQFAGFYAATEKGFYRDENIDITLNPGGVGIDIMDEVTSGRANFGLIAAEKIIVAHSEGKPVKAFATTYRRNPFALVSLPESGIIRPQDLLGRNVNIGGIDGLVQFTAMLSRLNLDINQVNITPYSYDLEPFFKSQVDVTPASAAGSLIGILKIRPDVNLIWAEDYGIHFYSDTLFTTDQIIADQPDLVLRFLRATIKGHQYAINHPDEALQITLKYAADQDPEIQSQMLIASIPLINTGEDQIGWMQDDVWQDMQAILLQQGIITSTFPIPHFVDSSFLNEVYQQ